MTAICIQLSTPVHSNTVSNPSSNPRTPVKTSSLFNPSQLVLATSRASAPLHLGPLGKRCVPVAQPISFAKSSFPCSISTAMTVVQPLARAREQVRRPTAPAPRTRILDPGAIWARLNACRTTERGSARAAAWRSRWSGILLISASSVGRDGDRATARVWVYGGRVKMIKQ